MPLRKAALRRPRRASTANGAMTMARSTDLSIAIRKQTAISRRLPKVMLTRRSGPRVNLGDLYQCPPQERAEKDHEDSKQG
jgi:hypothetical protein